MPIIPRALIDPLPEILFSHWSNSTLFFRNENNLARARDNSPNSVRRLTAGLVNGICQEEGVSQTSGSITLPSGSGSKILNIGEQKPMKQATLDEFVRMGQSVGLSHAQTKEVATFVRSQFGRYSVQPGLKIYLPHLKDETRHFFTVETVQTIRKNAKKKTVIEEERPMVYCNRIDAFIDHVLDRRNIEEGNVDIQFGLDDGRVNLKV